MCLHVHKEVHNNKQHVVNMTAFWLYLTLKIKLRKNNSTYAGYKYKHQCLPEPQQTTQHCQYIKYCTTIVYLWWFCPWGSPAVPESSGQRWGRTSQNDRTVYPCNSSPWARDPQKPQRIPDTWQSGGDLRSIILWSCMYSVFQEHVWLCYPRVYKNGRLTLRVCNSNRSPRSHQNDWTQSSR